MLTCWNADPESAQSRGWPPEVQADESDESLLDTAILVAQTAVLASNYDLEDPEMPRIASGRLAFALGTQGARSERFFFAAFPARIRTVNRRVKPFYPVNNTTTRRVHGLISGRARKLLGKTVLPRKLHNYPNGLEDHPIEGPRAS